MNDFLILVDDNDKPWGKLEKRLVHELGLLHRAFSVFLFNAEGDLLLQRRAFGKYHSGGLWTNACCSHPRFGESLDDAVARRLEEEMGLSCETAYAFRFIYRAPFDNGLTEHELDHVFTGLTDEKPKPDPAEVADWKFADPGWLLRDIKNNPALYTVWFRLALPRVLAARKTRQVA
jgi:isopentenyl-diphosphate delta-isomerase